MDLYSCNGSKAFQNRHVRCYGAAAISWFVQNSKISVVKGCHYYSTRRLATTMLRIASGASGLGGIERPLSE